MRPPPTLINWHPSWLITLTFFWTDNKHVPLVPVVIMTHACLGWGKLTLAPSLGIPKKQCCVKFHGYLIFGVTELIYISFPVFVLMTQPEDGHYPFNHGCLVVGVMEKNMSISPFLNHNIQLGDYFQQRTHTPSHFHTLHGPSVQLQPAVIFLFFWLKKESFYIVRSSTSVSALSEPLLSVPAPVVFWRPSVLSKLCTIQCVSRRRVGLTPSVAGGAAWATRHKTAAPMEKCRLTRFSFDVHMSSVGHGVLT